MINLFYFVWVLLKWWKGGDPSAAMDSASQICSAQCHLPWVLWQAVPAPIFTVNARIACAGKSQSYASTRTFPEFLLLNFPVSAVTKGVPSSCADRENLFLLMTGMYFCLYLNLLDLTKALWNVQCQFYAWKNREVNWVVKGEGKPGSIPLSQAILPLIWFPDLARNTTVSIWKWGKGGGKVK